MKTFRPIHSLRAEAEFRADDERRERVAAAATCQWHVMGESGQQTPCGQPAQWQNRRRPQLTYCDPHGREVARNHEVIALRADADGRRETLTPIKWSNR